MRRVLHNYYIRPSHLGLGWASLGPQFWLSGLWRSGDFGSTKDPLHSEVRRLQEGDP